MSTYLEAYRAARAASQERTPATSTSDAKHKQDSTKLKDAETERAALSRTPSPVKESKRGQEEASRRIAIEIGKQKGLYDTEAVRTQVHKWQASAAEASVQDLGEDLDHSPRKMTRELKESTAPCKRVTSDEHWKKDRATANSSEQPRVRKATALGFHTTVYIPAEGKSPEGFVRKRTSPAKPSISASPPKTFEPLTRRKIRQPPTENPDADIGQRLHTVFEKDEGRNKPNGEPETPSKQMLRDQFPNCHVRKSRKAPTNERPLEEEIVVPNVSKPMLGRMHAWLSATPDPFVEELDDPEAGLGRPKPLSELGSMLGPRATPPDVRRRVRKERQRPRELHGSDGDDASSSATSLKRQDAYRNSQSPRKHSNVLEDDANAAGAGALQLAQVPGLSPDRHEGPLAVRKNHRGTKRSVTSHADLISVLSLPNEQSRGLAPAASLRTPRSRLGAATVDGLLDEVRNDESKYLRDLKTLVDGVIPVLLNRTLSGSDHGITNSSTKETIVDLGVALERLQISHRSIPLDNAHALLAWAQRSHQIYVEYIKAWRMEFKDVMINLAPKDSSGYGPGTRSAGDGERVDVTFLLKRPLVRLRHLARTMRSIDNSEPSNETGIWAAKYQGLVDDAKIKQDLERARLEDLAAAAIDSTRVRNPESLAPMSCPSVPSDRCVRARDVFDLHMDHSSGQKLDCRVMLFLRDDKIGDRGGGDVLICQLEDSTRWLLFPPISLDRLSARKGVRENDVVIMMRSHCSISAEEWRELIVLTSDSDSAPTDWLNMLGSNPTPPQSVEPRNSDETPLRDVVNPKAGGRIAQWIGEIEDVGDPDALSNVNAPFGEQSILSGWTVESQERSRGLPFQLDNYVGPAVASYATKAKTNLRNMLSDFSTLKLVPTGADRSRSFPRKPVPGRPQARRNISPISSEHTHSVQHSRSSSPSTVAHQMCEDRPSSLLQGRLDESGVEPIDGARDYGRDQSDSRTRASSRSYGEGHRRVTNVEPTPRLSPDPTRFDARRRSSSPLKHEYVPPMSGSDESAGASDDGFFEGAGSVTSESSVDNLVPDLYPDYRVLKDTTPHPRRPSNSLAREPGPATTQQTSPQNPEDEDWQRRPAGVEKTVASIFTWSNKGSWTPLHPDVCSIVVSAGLIEAFRMTAAHSSSLQEPREVEMPLVALELTPLVPLRQGTAIDISIRSPPTANSQIKSGSNIMFRSRTGAECDALYQLINNARINNPRYLALQNARPRPAGGAWSSYMDRQANSRGSSGWWKLGSKKGSYRASSKRNTASILESQPDMASTSSTRSALKRFSAGSDVFNVGRSTITSRAGGNSNSRSSTTFTGSSGSSTPIRLDPAKGTPAGMTDLKVRLYERETSSKWRDMGSAHLMIMHPPRPNAETISATGHLQQEKRIVVTGKAKGETLLDVTLGETSFERVARTGVAVKVWEQHEEVGKTGGVLTAVARVFMIQMKTEAEAAYTFSLVGRQRY